MSVQVKDQGGQAAEDQAAGLHLAYVAAEAFEARLGGVAQEAACEAGSADFGGGRLVDEYHVDGAFDGGALGGNGAGGLDDQADVVARAHAADRPEGVGFLSAHKNLQYFMQYGESVGKSGK
jgi:hypothetical protein